MTATTVRPPHDLLRHAVAARAITRPRVAGETVGDEPHRAASDACSHWPTYPVWAALFAAEPGTGPWSAVADLPRPGRPRARRRRTARLAGAGGWTALRSTSCTTDTEPTS
ncbi:hypothetical protein [Myceligenerans salitolerans]|uniref:Uncharacterized protein n=1 Tax=Myceligenerans salitolerans TaxID=1230528 RepID=A0ABS3I4Y8_9MICO|nr:hypothetical protein [Myceligenerans salitolerans]MBO0608067.1 hypothetical protein [Myceligenerans salitolerans]